MRPHFNSHHRPYNNQPQPRPQFHGANAQPPQQQVMPNPGNFCPNPMQMLPQFQLPMLNNPLFANQNNAVFQPNQLLPFQQAQMQQLLAHNILMQNQLMQMQMAASGAGPRIPGNGPMGLVNFGGVMQPNMNGTGVGKPPMNGNGSSQVNNSLVSNDAAAASQNNGGMGWKNSPNKNSNWSANRDTSQRGHAKQPFHHGQNAKGNFKSHNNNKREQDTFGAKDFSPGSSNPKQEGKKSTLVVNYTAEEINKWREERRKNHPSRGNVDKTSKETAEPEVTDAVKARRQQLKEILAKQAELGCEVAEIPPGYLSESEQQVGGRGANKRVFPKKERFQNKFNKRGKFHQNDRFPNRQRPADQDATNTPDQHNRFNKKQRLTSNPLMKNRPEPSLLKKLLSSDIKRDKKHLLQVLRFMTMNSFFKDFPETPLKFPEVTVRDDSKIVEEKAEAWNVDATDDSPENSTDITGNGETGVLDKVAVICGGDDMEMKCKGVKLVNEEQEEGEIIN